MAEKPIAIVDPVTYASFGNYCLEVVELLRVGVVSERIGIRERFTIVAYSTSRKIESDCAKSSLRQLLRDVGKK
jgi:hypothetical protein